jgi:hypothetical protein
METGPLAEMLQCLKRWPASLVHRDNLAIQNNRFGIQLAHGFGYLANSIRTLLPSLIAWSRLPIPLDLILPLRCFGKVLDQLGEHRQSTFSQNTRRNDA